MSLGPYREWERRCLVLNRIQREHLYSIAHAVAQSNAKITNFSVFKRREDGLVDLARTPQIWPFRPEHDPDVPENFGLAERLFKDLTRLSLVICIDGRFVHPLSRLIAKCVFLEHLSLDYRLVLNEFHQSYRNCDKNHLLRCFAETDDDGIPIADECAITWIPRLKTLSLSSLSTDVNTLTMILRQHGDTLEELILDHVYQLGQPFDQPSVDDGWSLVLDAIRKLKLQQVFIWDSPARRGFSSKR